eukprot:TRINITY_DN1596_c0_g1_i1.p1 TRINITY_DN1596_c0_g1~~TRINITY_DN1596_c0_g1_i1.p1  ORF type:complete len:258 (+),score=132.02 TRINITY_DN1596_c0_g1_i1:58-774(+)
MPNAFLEISAGTEEANKAAAEGWRKVSEFIKSKGADYGLSCNDPDALTEDDEAMLADILTAEPALADVSPKKPADPVLGTLVISLYSDKCPKTTANFHMLCTGEKGKGKQSGKPLHYLNSVIHRLVPGTLFQGGDFVKGTGAAGESIYGLKFKDEKEGLKIKHTGLGDVGMANGGKDSNSSQFYITLDEKPLSKLDGGHVVFGKVIDGLDVLKKIAAYAGDKDGPPTTVLRITACGMR